MRTRTYTHRQNTRARTQQACTRRADTITPSRMNVYSALHVHVCRTLIPPHEPLPLPLTILTRDLPLTALDCGHLDCP